MGPGRSSLLGAQPAIAVAAGATDPVERRALSAKWLAGTILTGCAGALLIGTTLFIAAGRRATLAQAPEMAQQVHRFAAADGDDDLQRGDRLLRTADIVADKQSFKAPTTVAVGDKQVIRLRGYTRVSTALTLTPTDQADKVPPFNPSKLLGSDEGGGEVDVPTDPGPLLDASEVGFTTSDLAGTDPARFGPGLSQADAAAQVAERLRVVDEAGGQISPTLPPQFLLMRAARPSLAPGRLLSFAGLEGGKAPDAAFSSISVRMTPENVTLVPRSARGHEGFDDRLVVLRHGETLEDLLRSHGATPDQVAGIVEAFGARRGEPPVPEGRRLRLIKGPAPDVNDAAVLVRVAVYADETLDTTVALADDGHYVRIDPAHPAGPPKTQQDDDENKDEGGMRLYDSIYQTALKQQIPPVVIAAAIRTMSNDVDFQQPVQAGDSLDLFYAEGDNGGHPDLLFASLAVRNALYRYYRFAAPDDTAPGFYDDAGRAMRKFLIRTPVTGGVFTSGFGMRFHPVLGYSRPHLGVDWAAPVGTPIMAAGDGTVLKAERSSSYGNHIEIQHANGYVTTYSHMVGFARGMADGLKVRQGQVIGYLGQTGLATGPHLHYEVIVNGRFVDPMRVKLAQSKDITDAEMPDFKREHDRIDALMASAPNAPAAAQAGRLAN